MLKEIEIMTAYLKTKSIYTANGFWIITDLFWAVEMNAINKKTCVVRNYKSKERFISSWTSLLVNNHKPWYLVPTNNNIKQHYKEN